eukprot:392910-Amphidinium_carterae.1
MVQVQVQDIDPDTDHGRMVRGFLETGIVMAAQRTLLSTVHAGFVIFDAMHCVIMCKPTYRAVPVAYAEEVGEI